MFIKQILAATILLLSFSAFSAVIVELDTDLAPVIIDGKETGLRINTQRIIELDNGQNQLVVRVSKLLTGQSQFEKYYSNPVVLTFEAHDTRLYVSPAKEIKTKEQAKLFKNDPQMNVVDASGNPFSVQQGVLMPGDGLVRDYRRELEAFNKTHGLTETARAEKDMTTASDVHEKHHSQALEMVQYWYARAAESEQQIFSDWAFLNRKTVSEALSGDSQPLNMLGYWYAEAEQNDRVAILKWLLEQE